MILMRSPIAAPQQATFEHPPKAAAGGDGLHVQVVVDEVRDDV